MNLESILHFIATIFSLVAETSAFDCVSTGPNAVFFQSKYNPVSYSPGSPGCSDRYYWPAIHPCGPLQRLKVLAFYDSNGNYPAQVDTLKLYQNGVLIGIKNNSASLEVDVNSANLHLHDMLNFCAEGLYTASDVNLVLENIGNPA